MQRYSDNQIYWIASLVGQVMKVTREPRKFMPIKQFIGLQAIDAK